MILQEKQILTARQIFKATKQHLMEQQEAAFYDQQAGVCAYHALNKENKPIACAIGFRIPESEYHLDIENQNVIDLIEGDPDLAWLRPIDLDDEIGNAFLESLQQLHDHCSVEDWTTAFDILENYWFDGETVRPYIYDEIHLPVAFTALCKCCL